MAENVDYKNFRLHMGATFGDRIDRVENVLVAGMPDINYCADGVESWIEQKSPREPVRPTTPLFGSNHRVSQDQMNWFKRQTRAGGRCFFLITTDKRWILIDGRVADVINQLTIGEILRHAEWTALKPIREKDAWIKLRQALTL